MPRRLALAAALAALLATAAAADLAGPARAVDGDTLVFGGLTLRLHGVDAPETAQSCGAADGGAWDCGAAAAARLAELAAAEDLVCEAIERDRYGRVVGRCAAGGDDLGAVLVSEGLAWAYIRYSLDYAELEAEARAAGVGVWQGPATVAWDWRRGGDFLPAAGGASPPAPAPAAEPAAAPVPAEAPAGCVIKGNVNARGERIYHTPASPWYGRVRMSPPRGQRWFCNEAEAEAAGWRAVGGG